MRERLNAKPDPQFAEKCHDICQTYRLAPEHVERREFEYTRHGACPLTASFNIATGEVSADIGETHTEEDFPAHLAALVQQPRTW